MNDTREFQDNGFCEMSAAETTDELLVRIITLQGDEFTNLSGLSDDELTAHLSQWDYGDENDQAALFNGYDSVPEVEYFGAQTIHYEGIDYWVTIDNDQRMCSLLRRPLTKHER